MTQPRVLGGRNPVGVTWLGGAECDSYHGQIPTNSTISTNITRRLLETVKRTLDQSKQVWGNANIIR